jgi:hypothetical protein
VYGDCSEPPHARRNVVKSSAHAEGMEQNNGLWVSLSFRMAAVGASGVARAIRVASRRRWWGSLRSPPPYECTLRVTSAPYAFF